MDPAVRLTFVLIQYYQRVMNDSLVVLPAEQRFNLGKHNKIGTRIRRANFVEFSNCYDSGHVL
jgi:hypothetical protein